MIGLYFHSHESSPFGIIWIYLVCQTVDSVDRQILLHRKQTPCSGNCNLVEGTTRLLDDVLSVLGIRLNQPTSFHCSVGAYRSTFLNPPGVLIRLPNQQAFACFRSIFSVDVG